MDRLIHNSHVHWFDVHKVYHGGILQDATMVDYVHIETVHVTVVDQPVRKVPNDWWGMLRDVFLCEIHLWNMYHHKIDEQGIFPKIIKQFYENFEQVILVF